MLDELRENAASFAQPLPAALWDALRDERLADIRRPRQRIDQTMQIDAHQHYWDPARGDYGWLTPELQALYRRFGPEDLEAVARGGACERTVVVQAAPTVDETRYLLDLARDGGIDCGCGRLGAA